MVTFRCPICNQILKELSISHLRTHGLTVAEFIKKYPEHKNKVNIAMQSLGNKPQTAKR